MLCDNGANMESKDEHHCTPLHLACKKGANECLQELLRRGSNINALDNRSWSPLHYASYNGHPKAVNFLVKTEADTDKLPSFKNSQDRTAFIIAKDDKVKKAFNHIWKSCKEGDLDMVRNLIWEGQDVNEQTVDQQNTPLHFAARNGHYLVAKYLLQDCKADITRENIDGAAPWNVLQNSLMETSQKVPAIKAKLKGKTSPAYEAAKLRLKMLQDTEELFRLVDQANRKQ